MIKQLQEIKETLKMYADGELHGNIPAAVALKKLDAVINKVRGDKRLQLTSKGLTHFQYLLTPPKELIND